MATTKILITAVGAPPGYNAARALEKRAEFTLVLTDSDKYASGLYRFEKSVSYVVPSAKNENKYIESLLNIAEKEGVRVILPCLEDEILVLSRHLNEFLNAGVSIPIPGFDKVIQGCDKLKLMQLAQKLNIPHPQTLEINHVTDLKKNDLKFPLIVKPKISHGARGFVQINDVPELNQKVAELIKQFGELILQEFIPGESGSMLLCGLLFDQQHQLKVSFQSRSLKTLYSFGGPAIVGEPIINEEIRSSAKSLMKEIGGWIGPVNMEYKMHSQSGIPYLMDFNPRLWGYGSLPVFCGIDFPLLWAQIGLNQSIQEVHQYDMDKVMIRANEDFAITKSELKGL